MERVTLENRNQARDHDAEKSRQSTLFQRFFIDATNSSMEIAAMLAILIVPLEPSSMDTLLMVLLSGAFTMFAKS